ncbi:MAG: hypothetical protein RLZZ65_1203 [Bacteroidota bacterium]|jgi:hypothetical protein
MLLKKLYRFLSPKWQKLYMEYKVAFQPRYGHGKPPHSELFELINKERATFETLLHEALQHQEVFYSWKKKNEEANTSLPVYNNDFLPGLDMIAIYTMIKHFQPKRYVEVGSGNSTKVAFQAAKDLKQTEIISIDPAPRAEIDELADTIIRKPFENIDFDFLFSLEANDILFIDNSHRILPNSDATVFFLEVLPKLAKGVIVHIHDIYLPYDYPQFMADRFYSEQYGLAMYLLANPEKYKTILPNYFISEDPQLSQIVAPIFTHPSLANVEKHGGSFWLQIQ